MKKLIVLGLVISFIVAIPGNLAAKEKRGAYLEILKKDGQIIKGYLVAVKFKQKLLLLMDKKKRTDITINIHNTSMIIRKKSYALVGLGIGIAAGAVIGALSYQDPGPGTSFGSGFTVTIDFGPEFNTIIGVVIGGGVGAIVGAMAGIYEEIQIEGKSEAEIEEILEKLRKKARIPDYN